MGEADKLDGAGKCSGKNLEQSLQLPDYQMECGLWALGMSAGQQAHTRALGMSAGHRTHSRALDMSVGNWAHGRALDMSVGNWAHGRALSTHQRKVLSYGLSEAGQTFLLSTVL